MRDRGDQTREALLGAAERLFAERGYSDVGTRELAAGAAANVSAIKYHFGDKRGLYVAAVRRAMERRPAAAPWEALNEKPKNRKVAAAQLAIFIRLLLVRLLGPSEDTSTKLLFREAAEPSEAIDSVVAELIQPLETLLVEVIGTIRPGASVDDSRLAAQSVLGQISHYRVFMPFLQRMRNRSLRSSGSIERIAAHISGFSLSALGCNSTTIEQAIASASTSPNRNQKRNNPR